MLVTQECVCFFFPRWPYSFFHSFKKHGGCALPWVAPGLAVKEVQEMTSPSEKQQCLGSGHLEKLGEKLGNGNALGVEDGKDL